MFLRNKLILTLVVCAMNISCHNTGKNQKPKIHTKERKKMNKNVQNAQRVFSLLKAKFIGKSEGKNLILCCSTNKYNQILEKLNIQPIVNLQEDMVYLTPSGQIFFINSEDKNVHKIGCKISDALKQMKHVTEADCIVDLEDKDILKIAEISGLVYPEFIKYKTKTEDFQDKTINFIVSNPEQTTKSFKTSDILVKSALETIKLVNMAPNHMRPSDMAREAKNLESLGIKCTILEGEAIEKMECLVAVGKGSSDKSKLIVLEYIPNPGNKNKIAFVGKGITFDTGGYSLKPSSSMLEMHSDMTGGANVIGIMSAIANMKLDVNVIGVVACAENMVSGEAMRPEDIYTSYSGKTVHINNTDAEGRLVLADALSYVQQKYDPEYIIDFATLTGAIMVALGKTRAGIYSNSKNLTDIVYQAGEDCFEKVWPMPLDQEYIDSMKGDFSDLTNVSAWDRLGGSATAAAFLSEFVDLRKTQWMHLDIASTAYFDSASNPYHRKGGTGFGVRLAAYTLLKIINQ